MKVAAETNRIFSKDMCRNLETENTNIESSIENRLLKSVCKNNEKDFELINNLLTLQHSKTLLLRNHGLQNDIENQIEAYSKVLEFLDVYLKQDKGTPIKDGETIEMNSD